MEGAGIEEEELQMVYNWVDEIPLSRPKRNIARDFADGVLMAEIIKHFHPKLIDLHNYPAAHSVQQKANNWNTLNTRAFKKLGFQISKKDIENVVACSPEAVERVLLTVRYKLDEYRNSKSSAGFRASPTTGMSELGTLLLVIT